MALPTVQALRRVVLTRRRLAAVLAGAFAPALFGTGALAGQQPSGWPASVCVVQNGELREVQARVDSARGDTTVDGVPFSRAYPATGGYAAGELWYQDNEIVRFDGREFSPYARPLQIEPRDLVRLGTYEGVPLFREPGGGPVEVLYLPVRPGCFFQAYQRYVPDPVRVRTRNDWPSPSPRPTAQLRITELVLPRRGPRPTFQQVADRLEVAFTRSGYEHVSYYAAPDGFAMVMPAELFRDGGAPASRGRFPTGGLPVEPGSAQDIVRQIDNALEKGPRGHYRVIAVLVTPYPLAGDPRPLSAAERTWWKRTNGRDVPPRLSEQRLKQGHEVTVLVYEFERDVDGGLLRRSAEPRAPVEAHLRATGVWRELNRR